MRPPTKSAHSSQRTGERPLTRNGEGQNENGLFDAGEQSIPYGSGNSSCVNRLSTSPGAPSVNGTCDGVWGQAHVRQSSVIVLSGSEAFVSPRSFSMAGARLATAREPEADGQRQIGVGHHDPAGAERAQRREAVAGAQRETPPGLFDSTCPSFRSGRGRQAC